MGIALIVIVALVLFFWVAGRGHQKNATTVAKTAVVAQQGLIAAPKVAAAATVHTLDAARKGRELATAGLGVANEKKTEIAKTIKVGAEDFGQSFKAARQALLIEKGIVEAKTNTKPRRNRNKSGRTTEKKTAVA